MGRERSEFGFDLEFQVAVIQHVDVVFLAFRKHTHDDVASGGEEGRRVDALALQLVQKMRTEALAL